MPDPNPSSIAEQFGDIGNPGALSGVADEFGSQNGFDDFGEFDNPHGNFLVEEQEDTPEDEDLDSQGTQEDEPVSAPQQKVKDEPQGESASYWQSRHDKLATEFAQYKPIIDGLVRDPETAQLVFDRWNKATQGQPAVAASEPTPPEDFDPLFMYTPGTSSYEFMQAQKKYDREMLRQELAGEVESRVGEKLRPIVEERQAKEARMKQHEVLSKTRLPVDKYDEFLSWVPTADDFVEAYAIKHGLSSGSNGKREEFSKIKANSQQAAALRKPGGGEPPKKMDESTSFVRGLASVAPKY